MCPRCGQLAPTIVQGLSTYCVACGKPRSPLSAGMPVNVAGRSAQLGGTVAKVIGWSIFVGGLAFALVIGAVFQALFPAGVAGWILGGVISVVTALVAVLLLVGGSKAQRAGVQKQHDATVSAIEAIAARQHGVVTAEHIARALSMPVERADAILTDLVKQGERVRLEIDADGRLIYLVGVAAPPPARVRVAVSDVDEASEQAALDEISATEAASKGSLRR